MHFFEVFSILSFHFFNSLSALYISLSRHERISVFTVCLPTEHRHFRSVTGS